jgi:hypothetical protein
MAKRSTTVGLGQTTVHSSRCVVRMAVEMKAARSRLRRRNEVVAPTGAAASPCESTARRHHRSFRSDVPLHAPQAPPPPRRSIPCGHRHSAWGDHEDGQRSRPAHAGGTRGRTPSLPHPIEPAQSGCKHRPSPHPPQHFPRIPLVQEPHERIPRRVLLPLVLRRLGDLLRHLQPQSKRGESDCVFRARWTGGRAAFGQCGSDQA